MKLKNVTTSTKIAFLIKIAETIRLTFSANKDSLSKSEFAFQQTK